MNFFKKIFFTSNQKQSKQTNPIKTQNSQEQIPLQVLTQLFERSAKYIAEASTPISDENKLVIYGVYKQATVGDCNTPKPSMLDFVGKSKWNAWKTYSGMQKKQAMKLYISNAVQFVPDVQKKIETYFEGNSDENNQKTVKQVSSSATQSITGLKMVEQKDYSDSYSHPYFRLIEKNLPIQKQILSHELLLQINNNPKCYPLHFAIDKERADLVKDFLALLSVQEINQMQDEDGTGIQEYAQLIENDQIIKLVEEKLTNS